MVEAANVNASMARRMANIQANMGRRTPQGGDNKDNMEEDDKISTDDVANSVFGKQSQPTATSQRQKRQATSTGNKPILKTVVFIEVRVTQEISPLEGIRTALSIVFLELSRNGGIKNLKVLTN